MKLSKSFVSFLFVCLALMFVIPAVGVVSGQHAIAASSAFADTPAADSSSSAAAVSVAGVQAVPAVVAEPSTAEKLLAVLPAWLKALSVLISACAGLAALTPSPKDDSALLYLRKLIDFLALNFGNASNASSAQTDQSLR